MKPYLKIALGYLVFGILWIFFSDQIAAAFSRNIDSVTHAQTAKGWVFVIASSGLIFLLSRRAFLIHARDQREKLVLFKKTVGGAHHILLNYLNQMQLVTVEAESCTTFDREIIEIAKTASAEAATELMKLVELESLTSEQVDSLVYRGFGAK